MATFEYQGFDSKGTQLNGVIEAENEEKAKAKLKVDGIIIKRIFPEKKHAGALALFETDSVSSEEIEFLTAEISLLLDSGVKIDKAVDILKRTKSSKGLKKVLEKLSSGLRKGTPLADVLVDFPEVFDSLYINLIRIGEETGQLAQIFKGLSKDLKFRRELKKKVIQASTYPMVILAVCVVCVFGIFNFIVPKMSTLFSGVADLPIYTQIMLSTSEWVQSYQLYLLALPVVIFVFIQWASKQRRVVLWWHQNALSIPLIGSMTVQIERIRFNSSLALMLDAGMPIDKAMELSIGNIKNSVLKRELKIASEKVKSGAKLSTTLQHTAIYPPFFASLLEVGEESGQLSTVFDEITNRSRNEFEDTTQKMTTIMEPMLILFMGLIVGSVVVVMLLSMVSVNDVSF
jgi:type II secretory pathway component PulF